MNYFVTYDFADQLSGIEHAQINRLNVFNKFAEEKSSIVTFAYNRFLNRSIKKNMVKISQVVNMYDYLQEIPNDEKEIEKFRVYVKDIICDEEMIVEKKESTLYIKKNNKLTKKIFLMNNPIFDNQVNYVETYDKNEYIVKTDYYDIRGFKSMTDIYGQHGGVSRELNYTIQGKSKIESVYKRMANGKILPTEWLILNEDGSVKKRFSKKKDLQIHFLDALNSTNHENNLFVSDRAYLTDTPLIEMKTQRKLFVFWHSVFVPNGEDFKNKKPFDTFLFEKANDTKIDGLLAATNEEVNDLKQALGDSRIPVFKVNSALVSRTETFVPFSERRKMSILTVARMSEEKRLKLGVEIFEKIHKVNDSIIWSIYGYSQNGYRNELQKLIDNKGLSDNIKLFPYSNDLEITYKKNQLFWMLSKFEGFNMAEVEALSFGTPIIAFDIKYGPNEVVRDFFNGFLIRDEDTDMFAKQTIKALKNQFNLEKMGRNGKRFSENFNDVSMWRQWEKLL